jgi:hypothetical protein
MAGIDGQERPTRRSYWLIAVLALLWNGFGCLDFVMTGSRNAAWLASLPPEVIDWLDAAPTWSLFTWALGVGGGLVGALCLLARSRHAVAAFAGSLLGLAGNQVWQMTSALPESLTSAGNIVFSVAIWAIALGLLWYAVKKRRDRVLR